MPERHGERSFGCSNRSANARERTSLPSIPLVLRRNVPRVGFRRTNRYGSRALVSVVRVRIGSGHEYGAEYPFSRTRSRRCGSLRFNLTRTRSVLVGERDASRLVNACGDCVPYGNQFGSCKARRRSRKSFERRRAPFVITRDLRSLGRPRPQGANGVSRERVGQGSSRELRSDVSRRNHPNIVVVNVDDREVVNTETRHHCGDLFKKKIRRNGFNRCRHHLRNVEF